MPGGAGTTVELHYVEQFAGGTFAATSGFVDGREERLSVPCGRLLPIASYGEVMAHVERQGGVGDVLCTPAAPSVT